MAPLQHAERRLRQTAAPEPRRLAPEKAIDHGVAALVRNASAVAFQRHAAASSAALAAAVPAVASATARAEALLPPTANEGSVALKPTTLAVSAARAEHNVAFVDTFFLVFWGTVLVGCLLIFAYRYQLRHAEEISKAEAGGSDTDPISPSSKIPKRSDLPQTMWALNLVSAIGQANIHFYYVATISTVMAVFQVALLFLVVHDINPQASPVTTQAASPWVKDVWTINCMKWLMTTFLCVQMVTEAGRWKDVYTAILVTNRSRLCASRFILCTCVSGQYIVLVFVVWGGVSTVLSFQAVPDILYSSMAICFVAGVDEAVFKMIHQLFDVEADFMILHCKKATTENLFEVLDADGDGQVSREEWLTAISRAEHHEGNVDDDEVLRAQPVNEWVDAVLKFMAAFPCLLGFFLMSRAFYTNVMPTERLHALLNYLRGLV
eukprot:TRINITY_DN15309_c0_g1_i1.p1 TRINITY_DN15309_c0_g1~~TRINITY_DN15309_c0_g1_i1.p1  ORF type:complete len:436 (+),score=92.84 TRINITY_DN15309_c0_g1_i1:55-1362(+)